MQTDLRRGSRNSSAFWSMYTPINKHLPLLFTHIYTSPPSGPWRETASPSSLRGRGSSHCDHCRDQRIQHEIMKDLLVSFLEQPSLYQQCLMHGLQVKANNHALVCVHIWFCLPSNTVCTRKDAGFQHVDTCNYTKSEDVFMQIWVWMSTLNKYVKQLILLPTNGCIAHTHILDNI